MRNPSTTSEPQGEITFSVRAPIPFTGFEFEFEEDPDQYNYPHLENDGNNYLSWKHNTEAFLVIRDLWDVVNGDIPIPDPSAPRNERAEWLRKDGGVRLQIMSTIKDEPFKAIMDTETAKECWDKLSAWYQRTWQPRLFRLFDKVFRTSFSDTEPLGPQIDALVGAAHMIRSLGQELDDRLVAFSIISSLPSSLSFMRTILLCNALCNNKLSDISTVDVTRLILDNEAFLKSTSAPAKSARRGKRAKKNKPARKH